MTTTKVEAKVDTKSSATEMQTSDCRASHRLDLTEKESIQKLAYLDNWALLEDKGKRKLTKFYAVASFKAGIVFANAIEEMTNQFKHHPEIHISYKEVGVFWQTYAVGGLTDLDFASAEACDVIFEDLSSI